MSKVDAPSLCGRPTSSSAQSRLRLPEAVWLPRSADGGFPYGIRRQRRSSHTAAPRHTTVASAQLRLRQHVRCPTVYWSEPALAGESLLPDLSSSPPSLVQGRDSPLSTILRSSAASPASDCSAVDPRGCTSLASSLQAVRSSSSRPTPLHPSPERLFTPCPALSRAHFLFPLRRPRLGAEGKSSGPRGRGAAALRRAQVSRGSRDGQMNRPPLSPSLPSVPSRLCPFSPLSGTSPAPHKGQPSSWAGQGREGDVRRKGREAEAEAQGRGM